MTKAEIRKLLEDMRLLSSALQNPNVQVPASLVREWNERRADVDYWRDWAYGQQSK